MMGFLPHFPLSFCLTFCSCLIFSLFLTPFLSFPLCLYVPSPLFIFSLFSSYHPIFVKSFKLLFLLEIFLPFLSISSPISLLSLFPAFLPKLLLTRPSLPDFPCSLLRCSLPPLSKSPLHYSLSLAAGASAAGIWDTPRLGGKRLMYPSHPASEGRRVLHVQVLGQWFLSTGCGSFI